MDFEVAWSTRAETDLRDIVQYIAQHSPRYADVTRARLISASRTLGRFPRFGRVVPRYARDDIREYFCRKYRIVYRVSEQRVTILSVQHGSKNWFATFDPDAEH